MQVSNTVSVNKHRKMCSLNLVLMPLSKLPQQVDTGKKWAELRMGDHSVNL